MSASKRKGTRWETATAEYLRAHGHPHAERRAPHGARDTGDITGLPGIVLECKNAKTLDLAGWMDELAVEIDNAGADWGFLVVKRRRRSPADGYVVMTLGQLARLLVVLDGRVPDGG